MDINRLISQLDRKKRELTNLRDRTLPVKAGDMAVNFFKDNFRKGGYQDGSLTRWPVTRRQQTGGGGADAGYGPLLSRRLNLMRSTRYMAQPGKTTILNDLIYARIHNEGGTLTHRVTPRMRKFAWAKFYEKTKGRKGNGITEDARFWKGLALTKKTQIRQVIPQRRFMGKAKELVDRIREMADRELKNIING